jgi:hypothetical protein
MSPHSFSAKACSTAKAHGISTSAASYNRPFTVNA